jgi:hypothetical protein
MILSLKRLPSSQSSVFVRVAEATSSFRLTSLASRGPQRFDGREEFDLPKPVTPLDARRFSLVERFQLPVAPIF